MRTYLLPAALLAAFALPLPSALAAPQGGFCHLPPWTTSAPFASLGRAVAMDATTALVGGTGGEVVNVLQRVGSEWYPVQTLGDPDGFGTAFGASLALDGDRLFVGAPSGDGAGTANGTVHVFERGPAGWVHVVRLESQTPAIDGQFGSAMSAHNGWLAVGAPAEAGKGRVHVWSFESGAPVFVNSVGGLGAGGELGSSVAIHRPAGSSSAYLFAGDPFDDTVASNGGAVRYFRVHPLEIAFGSVLAPAELDPGDVFGVSIAFDGQHLVVGASGDDDVAPSAGAAYVYDVAIGGPLVANFAIKLTGPGTDASDFFGRSVALLGSRLAVGATKQDQPNGAGGKVHLYKPAIFGNGWVYERRLEPDASCPASSFGQGLALYGDLALVGAPQSSLGATQSGGAYLFSMAGKSLPGGLCPAPYLATAIPYGPSKAGPGGTPTLVMNSPTVPGQTAVLVAKGLLPGVKPILLVGAAPTLLPFDGGYLLVANPSLVALPTVSAFGQVGVSWNVPVASTLLGVPIFMQVLSLDPGAAGAFQTVQSQGLGVGVGY